MALVCTAFVPGLLPVPGVVVAINGIVIVIYFGRHRYTHCLPTSDGLDGPDTRPITVMFSLHLHL